MNATRDALDLPPGTSPVEGKVLITGATGFIGRWAVEALKRHSADLHLVGRHDPGFGLPFYQADLLDAGERGRVIDEVRPALLLHTAWETDHQKFWTSPQNETWITASLDLTRRFIVQGGRRMVSVGTCAEYDWTLPGTAPWKEDRPCRPATAYGAAKVRFAEEAGALAAEAGIGFAWVRVFIPVGPDEKPARLVPSLIRALLAGEPATTGPGDLVRDFMDTRDAGTGLAAILASDLAGPVNIGSGVGVSIGEIATRLGELTGRPDLVGVGERPGREGEPPAMVADIGKLTAATGFRPRLTLDEMLEDAIRYWRGRAG